MLDEKTKRKPNFDERNAAPVVLADGQSLVRPETVARDPAGVSRRPGGDGVSGADLRAELDALIEAIAEADDRRSRKIVAVASLAAYLLRWHYDLTDAELDQLLAFRSADEASARLDAGSIRNRDRTLRPKSLSRWRRLTLLAQGTHPPMMLLEDAEDLCDFLQATGRTIRAAKWASEVIAADADERTRRVFLMAGAAPDLIIPVRMDADKALTRLTKVGAAGAHAGDQVAAGAQESEEGNSGHDGKLRQARRKSRRVDESPT